MGLSRKIITQELLYPDLFLTTRNNITLHIGNIFKEGELVETAVRKDSLLTATDGKKYRTKIYNPSLPPVEGIFFDGQIFDAYVQIVNLIKQAKRSITLIDEMVYLFGASLKDAGKKLFAYIKMQETPAAELLNHIR